MWIKADVTCRSQDDTYAWDHSVRKSLRPNRPQAPRSCRAGRPILGPPIPGCSVAGDQDPSRFLIRSEPDAVGARDVSSLHQSRPSAPRHSGEDGCWRRMAARPARATRRAAPAAPGPRRAEGAAVAMSGLSLVRACSSAELRTLRSRSVMRLLACRHRLRQPQNSDALFVSQPPLRIPGHRAAGCSRRWSYSGHPVIRAMALAADPLAASRWAVRVRRLATADRAPARSLADAAGLH